MFASLTQEARTNTHKEIYLGSTWQQFLPRCQILSADDFPWEGGIAKEAMVCHLNFDGKQKSVHKRASWTESSPEFLYFSISLLFNCLRQQQVQKLNVTSDWIWQFVVKNYLGCLATSLVRLVKYYNTVGYPQWFKGGAGLNSIGGVNKVQWSTEDAWQNVGQLLPCGIHARKVKHKTENTMTNRHNTW